jgi:hypothetical protein
VAPTTIVVSWACGVYSYLVRATMRDTSLGLRTFEHSQRECLTWGSLFRDEEEGTTLKVWHLTPDRSGRYHAFVDAGEIILQR